MKYRQATLLATESIMTAATKTIDINVKDVISRISLILELVNTNVSPVNHPLAAIKTITITDGSEIVASMTGYAAQAMAYYDTGQMPHNELNYEDNAYMRCFVPLNFGRYLYDERLGLDPMKYRNLQLHIEHNYALGGCTPDAATLRVVADLFDEKTPSPLGFLLNKEIISFTPATGSAKPVELPLDNIIRKLLVLNTNDNEEPDIEFESVKIDEEDGKRIVVDCLTMDLIRASSLRYGRFEEYFSDHLAATTAEEFFMTACKDIQIIVIPDTTGVSTFFTWTGGRGRTLEASAAAFIAGIVSGRCPHGAVEIPFGKQDVIDDWWDVTGKGKAKLTLTPRATPAIDTEKTTDVIVQSLQRY